ncbi:hypothetical protein [Xanthomonas euvesicatoria]|uniref:hypothetical protein n=1 Tax=Xanthomonas euvesicatoria TaxID=456327 RepID=UPI002405639B|nr:hypothetical protein [Xanthomonas euvesicatoria]MCP3045405.1 hypothetical protein [Xanthomonas euvesicatoria pv. allii]
MPITSTGLSHAVASTSQTGEGSTSQAQTSRPLPSPQPAQNKRAAIFDRLSALPPELRQNIVSRLDNRSKARLGAASRQLAADTRQGMPAPQAAAPHRNPIADVPEVDDLFPIHNIARMMAPLSADARQTLERKLMLKRMENLGSASPEQAAAAREKLQAFLAANPDYDPITDFGEVTSLARMRAAMQLVDRLPAVGDAGHSARERAYVKLVYSIWKLPESERGEAFTTLFAHIDKLPGQSGLPALEPFIFELASLPGEQREAPLAVSERGRAFMTLLAHINALPTQSGLPALEHLTAWVTELPECEAALRAVLRTPLAAHDQVALDVMEQAEKTGLGALSPHARLLVLALARLPLPECMNVIIEVAAQLPGPRARAVAILYHHAVLREGYNFSNSYMSVAEKLAASMTGRDVLPHLADLLVNLPLAEMRFDGHRFLVDACSRLYRDEMSEQERTAAHDITASVLLRLTNAVSQQPREKRFEAAWKLAEQAKSLDPERHRSVILAIRAQADAITPRTADFRDWCDERIKKFCR